MSCDPKLTRVRHIGAKVEATCGAGATFASSDFMLRPISITAGVEVEMIEDDTLSRTLSPRPLAPGERTCPVQVSTKLVGSGSASVVPETDVYLRGCGMKMTAVQKIPIGAVGSGPFYVGEEVTQAVSLAKGVVVVPCITGDSHLYFAIISGTWNGSGVVTGGESGATATPSGAHVLGGQVYMPTTDDQETIAIRVEKDGMFSLSHGAMGSFNISAESSNTANIEFSFVGKSPDNGEGDAAMTVTPTLFTSRYPTLKNAMCFIDRGTVDEFKPVLRSVSFDYQGEATMRKDGNDLSGLIASKITNRVPTTTFVAETASHASFPAFSRLTNATSLNVAWRFTAPDNTVWIWGKNAQLTAKPEGDADGFMTNDLTFRMNGTKGDDEFAIAFIY